MTACFLQRTMNGTLAPADADTAAYLSTLRLGQGLHGEFKRARDLTKHRRMFALFNFAFDMWDAPSIEFKGEPVAKNLDRFRKDVTILAGYYTAVTNLRGEVRLEAKSLAFHNMSQDEFDATYKAVLGVVWERILRAKGFKNEAEVDAAVQELLRFD